MVKNFMKVCEVKCIKLVVQYVEKCVVLKVIISDVNIFDDDCWDVVLKL